ncbi:MAG TPA: O-methyltransferase [Pyrinomonadaceae bacterium]|nr:O-methyltransferase [Pyrinomonadaceae bacterium]
MFGSGEKIDYNLRPAKQIERKMLCEAFRRLSVFDPVESYRYVGLGSFYFADFTLIHKSLGMTDMISIEAEGSKAQRFRFNRPFGCVSLRFGHSNKILEKLSWRKRTILWLDYDYRIDESCFSDISLFCNNARSGSMLIITVDAQTESEPDDLFDDLTERVGQERVPLGITAKSLTGWGMAKVSHRIIINEISSVIGSRNALREKSEVFTFRQLFNFHYKDSAQMLTVGGMIYADNESDKFQACNFGSLGFVRSASAPYKIELPRLTFREIRHLQSQLPIDPAKLKSKGIKREELRKYAKVYRWFPSFAEVEM